eukprot:CAMPEP_0195293792 /NCGR_PEP_ID=MMETSP0707-20130614/13354_1 /TAXON_ID=33640 /ORGANISM="Asterionellopsis glacialis, Strain CCMP134" /LENGTH=987 /DNA_ID=CAMNT_0040354587 /DNA_START=164 /DNA_END=3127 /DNA_ORIENTATION=+
MDSEEDHDDQWISGGGNQDDITDYDDAYTDDDGFVDYIATTTDPGPWMLISVCIYSISCLLILPILVVLGKRRQRRLLDEKKRQQEDECTPMFEVSIFHSIETGDGEKNIAISADDGHFLDDPPSIETKKAEMTICGGERALCSSRTASRAFRGLKTIAKFDRESKKIMKLGTPFVIASVFESFYEAVAVILVSKYLGVKALQAYVITNLLIGLSDVLIGGISDALGTVCPHAIGAENYKLAGQYVQIASVVYLIGSIPVMGMWWFIMDDCMRLFGFSEDVVEIGVQYTRVVIFDYILDGIFGNFTGFLDCIGYEKEGTAFDIITGGIDAFILFLLLKYVPGMNLFWVAYFHFFSAAISVVVIITTAFYMGWLDPFWEGLVGSFALKNTSAIKYILQTAIPLSLGSLLEYGEWETLTFFAAYLGPAEVAAWGIAESLWALFESATGGLSEAGSIRLAYHLGKGNVEQAPLSAWKSLFMSTVVAIFITIIFFICGDLLAAWFTSDAVLQEILKSMIPLVGLGNIFMVFGMVSWSLVGAQGRYKLATIVSAVMSFCVTLPLAAIFCIVYEFTLEGLTASVVIGYSTTGMVMAYILLMSDWEKLSKVIQECNKEEGVSLSDSSYSSSSLHLASIDSDNEEGLNCKVATEFDNNETECAVLDRLSESDSVSLSSFLNNEYGSPVSMSTSERNGSIKSKCVVQDLLDDVSTSDSVSFSSFLNEYTISDGNNSVMESSKAESLLDNTKDPDSFIDCVSLSSSQQSVRTLESISADCSPLDDVSAFDSVSFSSFLNDCGSLISLSTSQRSGKAESTDGLRNLLDDISLAGSLRSSSSPQRNKDSNNDSAKSTMENSKAESSLDNAKHDDTSIDCVSSSCSQGSAKILKSNEAECVLQDDPSTSDSVSFSSFLNERGLDDISLTGSLLSLSSSQRNENTVNDSGELMMGNSRKENLLDMYQHDNSIDCVSLLSSQGSSRPLEEPDEANRGRSGNI